MKPVLTGTSRIAGEPLPSGHRDRCGNQAPTYGVVRISSCLPWSRRVLLGDALHLRGPFALLLLAIQLRVRHFNDFGETPTRTSGEKDLPDAQRDPVGPAPTTIVALVEGFRESSEHSVDALVAGPVHEDGELVAAQPRHEIWRPERPAKDVGTIRYGLIPGPVAPRVVDSLEAVQVGEEEQVLRLIPPGDVVELLPNELEASSVVQPGQGVSS